ncbi:lysozyme inhibitor LprI family protein [Reyranella sp.]|uniref:lysozyme inhibitor LprI family protein n=1 Tax=Reyranella sp. TaxID=1929291 RepID=UPI003BAC53DE
MARSAARTCTLAALLALGGAGGAGAQTGLDCARAATPVERAICGNAELLAADRAVSASYAALRRKLGGAAREHLAADQARWLANRERACVGEPADVEDCLMGRDRDRAALLVLLADGDYPFVSEQAIVRSGEARGIPYGIDASYPQFDGTQADFTAVNRKLATATAQAVARVVPGPDADNGGGTPPEWRYEQAFTLYRPSDWTISVALVWESYTGGTHSTIGMSGTLVDLRTGAAVLPADVFKPGDAWLRELARLARADLKVPKLADMLKDTGRYIFLDDRLELSFNQYEGGPFTLTVPYEQLKTFLRPDGPIPPEAIAKETP